MKTTRALSFLALPLLVAAGCAVTADEPSPEPEKVDVAKQALDPSLPDVQTAFDSLAQTGLTLAATDALSATLGDKIGDAFGAALVDLILPTAATDQVSMDELVSALANLDSQLNAQVQSDFVTYAGANVTTVGQHIAAFQSDLVDDPTLSTCTTVRDFNTLTTDATLLQNTMNFFTGSVPSTAPADVQAAAAALQDKGFFVYVAAAQMDVTRRQMIMHAQMLLDPSHVCDSSTTPNPPHNITDYNEQRDQLVGALAAYVSKVRPGLDTRAAGMIASALSGIGDCSAGSLDLGPPSYAPEYWESFGSGSNMTTPWVSDPNLAHQWCTQLRDQYVDQQQRAAIASVDSTFGFAAQMVDAWSRMVDAYNVQLSPTSVTNANNISASMGGPPLPAQRVTMREVPLDFGGMYGVGSGGARYNDTLTGGQSCPSGFTSSQFAGQYGVDYNAFACTRTLQPGAQPTLDFGGMWGETDNCGTGGCGTTQWPNPITGAASCPAGYTQTQVLGADADHRLFYCSRPHNLQVRQQWLFGGTFGYSASSGNYQATDANNVSYANPATGGASCPIGYSSATVFGSASNANGFTDNTVAFCYKNAEDQDFGASNTKVMLWNPATNQIAYNWAGGKVVHWEHWVPTPAPKPVPGYDYGPGVEYYMDVLTMSTTNLNQPATVRFRHPGDNQCILPGASGTTPVFATCTEDPKFTFTVLPLPNTPVLGEQFQLQTSAGLCLAFEAGGNGYPMISATCSSSDPSQTFELLYANGLTPVRLRHDSDTQCLYTWGGGGGTYHWPCWGDPNMSYFLDPVTVDANGNATSVRLRHALTDTCISGVVQSNSAPETPSCWEDTNQVFQLPSVGGSQVQLANINYGCLYDDPGNGAAARIWTCNSSYSGYTFDIDTAR